MAGMTETSILEYVMGHPIAGSVALEHQTVQFCRLVQRIVLPETDLFERQISRVQIVLPHELHLMLPQLIFWVLLDHWNFLIIGQSDQGSH